MVTDMLLLSLASVIAVVNGHGAMVSPKPRSAHGQTWDDANKCGSANPYSKTGLAPGEYCGLGCLGEACLYYQIGCYQGCSNCSLQGKTLYPVPHDLTLAGCDASTMPEPTLGGGNKTLEYILRTHNIDGDSHMGDWTKWNPWRSPGSAGRGNPNFQPCGVNSGALASQPEPPTTTKDVPNGGPGTSLKPLPKSEWAVWKAGSIVEAEWAIYANHAGGYSYRLCKKIPGQLETEACYQKTPLAFATPETEIRYQDGSQPPFNITSPTTDIGTYPPGSQWRKNPVPMCNCDIGFGCGAKDDKDEYMLKHKTKSGYNFEDSKDHRFVFETKKKKYKSESGAKKVGSFVERRLQKGACKADPTCASSEEYDCKVCADDPSAPSWSCKTCCAGCTEKHADGGMYCVCQGKHPSPSPSPSPPSGGNYLCKDGQCYEGYGKQTKSACEASCTPSPSPSPSPPSGGNYLCKDGQCYEGYGKQTKSACEASCKPSPKRNNYFTPYKHTHLPPGKTNALCPTGVQFETFWDGGAGGGNAGRFNFTMVDRLFVPDVPAGEYSLSWRWDCEETPQVWNSCADIIITR